MAKAQELTDKFDSSKLCRRLDAFAKSINPFLDTVQNQFGQGCFWCVEQCEFATDIMFKERSFPRLATGVGITAADGMEILIHLGIDTVNLKGQGFRTFAKQGDDIKQGEALAEVDINYVKSQGISLVSPVVFTGGEKIRL